MNEIEFVELILTGKARLISVYFTVIAVCAVPFLAWPRVASYVGHLPICAQVPWLRGFLVGALAVLLVFATAVGWRGYKLVRFQQLPLPGAIVFRRTSVKRGTGIVVQGYVLCAIAVVVVAGLLSILPEAWGVFRPLSVSSGRCGVG